MKHQRLHWRIGLPFALFVLAGSVALLTWMGWIVTLEGREQLESLAKTNADFINRVQLPASDRMARQLHEVLGVWVFFREPAAQRWTPPLNAALLTTQLGLERLPADGRCHLVSTVEAVAVPLAPGEELLLARPAFSFVQGLRHPRTLGVVGAFLVSSFLVGWLVSRGLVRPLRHLASKLPDIEKPGPIDLPEAAREDEIGDVARAFVRTRGALQKERAERERAEKLAVLGRMTAALAHEIQNPVAAIKMHAQLWQGDGVQETAQVIEHEAARIEGLVNQWMFLSKPQPPVMSEVDVSALLTQVVRSHQAQCDHAQVKVELEIADALIVQGDAKRLAQVFSNLLVNAIQAMPRGGQLTVTGALVTPCAEVSFVDTGKGFSSEALTRFSEFFFSEKEGGMGIGLSVASEIVKAHGGELRVANRTEGGACVTVTLPRSTVSSL